MTWDGSAIKLYKGGLECSYSGDQTPGDPGNDSGSDGIIGNNAEGTAGFYGYIADLFIYSRALGDDELRWLALNGNYDETDLKDEWVVIPNFGAMGEYENFPLGQFHAATWAAADQDGENKWIWVSEFYVPRVTKISPTGVILKAVGGTRSSQTPPEAGKFYGPWGIDVDASHYLYVADSGYFRIQVFDQNGDFVAKWGSLGYDESPQGREDADIHFVQPRFVAAKRWGNQDGADVFVSECGTHVPPPPGVPVQVARVLKFQFWYSPGHVPRVRCDGAWGAKGPGDGTRGDSQFYDLRGIDLDSQGDVWVCDRGDAGSNSFLKEFDAGGTFKTKFSVVFYPADYCSGLGISSEGGTDYLYSSGGEMVEANHIAKFTTAGSMVASFDYFGPTPGHSYACWGGFPTTWGTVLSTDWFGGKAQEWQTDGTYVQTFQSPLRSDAYCVKSRNHTKYVDELEQLHPGQDKQVWERVTLPQDGTYRIQFLAYTNGQPVGVADVVPYVSYTGQPGNRVFSVSYENYMITDVEVPNQSDCYAAYVTALFSVLPGETQLPWDIGADVKVNADPGKPRLVYIASLCCLKE